MDILILKSNRVDTHCRQEDHLYLNESYGKNRLSAFFITQFQSIMIELMKK